MARIKYDPSFEDILSYTVPSQESVQGRREAAREAGFRDLTQGVQAMSPVPRGEEGLVATLARNLQGFGQAIGAPGAAVGASMAHGVPAGGGWADFIKYLGSAVTPGIPALGTLKGGPPGRYPLYSQGADAVKKGGKVITNQSIDNGLVGSRISSGPNGPVMSRIPLSPAQQARLQAIYDEWKAAAPEGSSWKVLQSPEGARIIGRATPDEAAQTAAAKIRAFLSAWEGNSPLDPTSHPRWGK